MGNHLKALVVIMSIFLVIAYSCTDDLVPEGFIYNGNSYLGLTKITDDSTPRNTDSFEHITIAEPGARGFEADGFFMLEGGSTGEDDYQYVYMRLSQDGTDNETEYWGRGPDFTKRVWLRYGPGNYTFQVYNTKINACAFEYDGDISSYGITEINPVYTFSIKNTCDEEGLTIYPSDCVQADSDQIWLLVRDIVKGIDSGEDQIRVIHEFVVTNLYYDLASTNAATRPKQDALSVLKQGHGVCEGYTCLFMALCRAAGYPTRAHISLPGSSSGAHAWASVYPTITWKYVDATLDDTGYTNQASSSFKEEYLLFTGSEFHENDGAGDYIHTGW